MSAGKIRTNMINSKLLTAKGNIFDIEKFGFDALALVINQKVSRQRPPLDLPSDFSAFKKIKKNYR